MTASELITHRRQKDALFKSGANSPLTPNQKRNFSGLTYYAYNPSLDLEVTVERVDETAQVFTTQNTIRNYRRYGRFTFTVDGQLAELTIYATPHGFFLPFVDANAGQETYPAGRYIDPVQINADTFHVDFNRAYNPLCVYDPTRFDCPITPQENRLAVAIRAGERNPTGDWNKTDHDEV
jgi:uncharacterized protein